MQETNDLHLLSFSDPFSCTVHIPSVDVENERNPDYVIYYAVYVIRFGRVT